MANVTIEDVLRKYIPEETVGLCTEWIVKFNVHLRITENRFSKYGDYRPLEKGKAHMITINHNLNRYAFLITFIHEIAHLVVQVKYGNRVMPHGKQWKDEYSLLLKSLLAKNIFPYDIAAALTSYTESPAASTCSDPQLMRVLKKHDNDGTVHVEQLAEGTLFKLFSEETRMIFKKGKRARTRFHCLEMNSGKKYMVSAMADAKPVEI